MISSLVNISHNVWIGSRARIGAGSCILGSSRIGEDAWVGPNATVSNRVRVGERARVTLGSVVVRDVAPDGTVSGNLAVDHERTLAEWRRLRAGRKGE